MQAKRSLFLLSLAALLASCGEAPIASSNSSSLTEESSSSTVESSSSEPSSESASESSSESSSKKTFEEREGYYSVAVQKDIYEAIGDVDIPYLPSTTQAVSEINDENETLAVEIYVQTPKLSSAEATFKIMLGVYGYTNVTEYGNFAYKTVSLTDDVIVQYAAAENYFFIAAYRLTNRLLDFPEATVMKALGESIPTFEAETYEVYESETTAGYPCVEIYGNNVGVNADSIYAQKLIKAGWAVEDYGTMFEATLDYLTIDFYLYDETTLYLRAYSTYVAWPSTEIKAILGVDLPEYVCPGVTYDYGYLKLDSGTYFVIYCDNAAETAVEDYAALLLENHWEESDETDNVFFLNPGSAKEHCLQLAYNTPTKCMAIAIAY